METQGFSLLHPFNRWLRESVTVKLASICMLVLLLLIPQVWVREIMDERQLRVHGVMKEVSEKWSSSQTITGPVLVIPYLKTLQTKTAGSNNLVLSEMKTVTENACFLPENLGFATKIEPQTLHRGIFDVVVYNSNTSINGHFSKPDIEALGLKPEDLLWQEAYLIFGLSDLRGIGETPSLHFGNRTYASEPFNDASQNPAFSRSIASKIPFNPADSIHPFSMNISLKGSGSLRFLPIGKNTTVHMEGNWGNPSFDGYYLPESRDISANYFSGTWKILHFNRPFPQQWVNTSPALEETAFGVNLLMPVDQYQQSIRTAKYGVLIILLTFVSLFLIELICKIKIHPFQYSLIGTALIVYYTLLLSFSEYIGFNFSYAIASLGTIILIALYSISFLKAWKISGLLASLLFFFYGYIFILTQQQDYALLLGSMGLFCIIAVLMFVSRKINWYGEKQETT